MLERFGGDTAQLQALERISGWTRERFDLPPAAAILVSELECALPGCPPLETVVAFWTDDGRRQHFKVFKPALAVQPADLPYAWQKYTLSLPEGQGCDCC